MRCTKLNGHNPSVLLQGTIKVKYIYNTDITACQVATPPQELTCHMGSHSVTCHSAEVIFPASSLVTGSLEGSFTPNALQYCALRCRVVTQPHGNECGNSGVSEPLISESRLFHRGLGRPEILWATLIGYGVAGFFSWKHL